MSKLIKAILWPLLALILFNFLYMFLGSLMSVSGTPTSTPKTITIGIKSNDIHADLLLPKANDIIDWSSVFPLERDGKILSTVQYKWVLIGKGDRDFYLKIPTWDKFNLWIILKAIFWPTPTLFHVDYVEEVEHLQPVDRFIQISPKQYESLVNYIKKDIKLSKTQKALSIPQATYFETDQFYEAKGTYHYFNTCNDWTNKALRAAGIKTPLWSPLKYGVISD